MRVPLGAHPLLHLGLAQQHAQVFAHVHQAVHLPRERFDLGLGGRVDGVALCTEISDRTLT